jgi:PKD repeat protein
MMKQLVKNARSASIVLFASTAIVLLGIFAVGCGGSDSVVPVVTSSFTATVNNTTGAVTFKNTSTNATIYLWDLGDGTTSTQFEPAKTYQTGTYTVKLTASNTAGGTATSENTFTVTLPGPPVDTTKPIITLIGDATINLTIGDPYTDKGATANDNLDGNITSKIVKAGTVNTAAAGTYTITYQCH